jgi:hypothetical protein
MRNHLIALFAAVGAGGVALAACGSSVSNEETPPPSEDAGTEAEASLVKDGNFGGLEAGEDAGCEVSCSPDLHEVLDCTGKVVSTCSVGKACGPGGQCIEACAAAKANKSAMGCEYYEHEIAATTGYCNAMYIVNSWDTPVSISAEANGVEVDVSSHAYLPSGSGSGITYTPNGGTIAPGEMAIVFLRGPCPAGTTTVASSAPPEWSDPAADTSIGGHALHVTTSAPVIAYDIQPFGGAASFITSATLLLPVSTWDKNYVAVTPLPHGENCTNPGFTVIASEDATDVTLLPNVNVVGGGGVSPSSANVPTTFTLGKGEALRLTQEDDLTSSILASTKPIGFWADQGCINIDQMACDGAHQQIPPVQALGSEYAGVRYPNRKPGTEEPPPWRVVGLVDGTKLSWEPSTPDGAPTELNTAEVVTFRASGPFVVKSQDKDHPFYMNAYMTGGAAFDNQGDPEFVNLVPAAQFLSRYVFFTDPTYITTNLVFTRSRGPSGFEDVYLDCVGKLEGWESVGSSGKYEYAYVDFRSSGCENGVHEAHSTGQFGLTVWGWDDYASYAYPAAMSVRSVNTVVVNPIPH